MGYGRTFLPAPLPAPPHPYLEATLHSIDDERARARWEALWEASPQRSPFSALSYVRAAAAARGASVEMHLVRAGDTDVAGALVPWRQRGPYRQSVILPFTPYAALLTRTADDEAAVHARRSAFEALAAALEARYHVLRFALPPAFTDVRPVLWRGWEARPFYTYHLPLAPPEALRARWSAGTRRAYEKAAGSYRFESPGAEAAGVVAELCTGSYARHERRPPLPPGRLAHLIEALHAAGTVRLFTVTRAGTPEGGLAVLHDGREAAYWAAGSTPGPAMTVLLGEALPRLHIEGIAGLDFVGANTSSIAEFKRRFGPVLQPYHRVTHCTRPELALLLRLLREA